VQMQEQMQNQTRNMFQGFPGAFPTAGFPFVPPTPDDKSEKK
jgi:hypothetical protein